MSTITATFDGVIEYCELAPAMTGDYQCNAASALRRAQCESKEHQMILTRR